MGLLKKLRQKEPQHETTCSRCGVPAPEGSVECSACGWDLRELYDDPLAERPEPQSESR